MKHRRFDLDLPSNPEDSPIQSTPIPGGSDDQKYNNSLTINETSTHAPFTTPMPNISIGTPTPAPLDLLVKTTTPQPSQAQTTFAGLITTPGFYTTTVKNFYQTTTPLGIEELTTTPAGAIDLSSTPAPDFKDQTTAPNPSQGQNAIADLFTTASGTFTTTQSLYPLTTPIGSIVNQPPSTDIGSGDDLPLVDSSTPAPGSSAMKPSTIAAIATPATVVVGALGYVARRIYRARLSRRGDVVNGRVRALTPEEQAEAVLKARRDAAAADERARQAEEALARVREESRLKEGESFVAPAPDNPKYEGPNLSPIKPSEKDDGLDKMVKGVVLKMVRSAAKSFGKEMQVPPTPTKAGNRHKGPRLAKESISDERANYATELEYLRERQLRRFMELCLPTVKITLRDLGFENMAEYYIDRKFGIYLSKDPEIDSVQYLVKSMCKMAFEDDQNVNKNDFWLMPNPAKEDSLIARYEIPVRRILQGIFPYKDFAVKDNEVAKKLENDFDKVWAKDIILKAYQNYLICKNNQAQVESDLDDGLVDVHSGGGSIVPSTPTGRGLTNSRKAVQPDYAASKAREVGSEAQEVGSGSDSNSDDERSSVGSIEAPTPIRKSKGFANSRKAAQNVRRTPSDDNDLRAINYLLFLVDESRKMLNELRVEVNEVEAKKDSSQSKSVDEAVHVSTSPDLPASRSSSPIPEIDDEEFQQWGIFPISPEWVSRVAPEIRNFMKITKEVEGICDAVKESIDNQHNSIDSGRSLTPPAPVMGSVSVKNLAAQFERRPSRKTF